MKVIAVALLVVGLLLNAMSASAEDPVPFRALMQNPGSQAGMASSSNAPGQSQAAPTQPAHGTITRSGKIMRGTGIALCAIGGTALIGTATLGENSWASSTDKDKLYGVGAGILGAGVVLIFVGIHHRSAK